MNQPTAAKAVQPREDSAGTPIGLANAIHKSDSPVQPRITVETVKRFEQKNKVLSQIRMSRLLSDKLAMPNYDVVEPVDPFRVGAGYKKPKPKNNIEGAISTAPFKYIEMIVYAMVRPDKTVLPTSERLHAEKRDRDIYEWNVSKDNHAYADSSEQSVLLGHLSTRQGHNILTHWPYLNFLRNVLSSGFCGLETAQACAAIGQTYNAQEAIRRTQSLLNGFARYKSAFIKLNEGIKSEVLLSNAYYRQCQDEPYYDVVHWFTSPFSVSFGNNGLSMAEAITRLPGAPIDAFLSFGGLVNQCVFDSIVSEYGKEAVEEGLQFLKNTDRASNSSFRLDNTVFSMLQYYGFLEVDSSYDPDKHLLCAQAGIVKAIDLLSKELGCNTYAATYLVTEYSDCLVDDEQDGGKYFEAQLIKDPVTL